jgi:hypothetical protein
MNYSWHLLVSQLDFFEGMWIWIKGLVSSWEATDELIRANQLGDYFIQWLNYCDCHVDGAQFNACWKQSFDCGWYLRLAAHSLCLQCFHGLSKKVFFFMTVIHFLCFAFRLKSASFVKGVSVFGQER